MVGINCTCPRGGKNITGNINWGFLVLIAHSGKKIIICADIKDKYNSSENCL